ncbi:MAG: rhodanese-like domain-containing protein [Phycisphaerales bacterium]
MSKPMRFVGRVAILIVVIVAAATVNSMQWPIYRDIADIRARTGATAIEPAPTSEPSAEESDPASVPDDGVDPDAGQAEPATAEPPVAAVEEDLPDYYISIADAFELWDEGMPFVDARTENERVVGTVEGAFHLETRNFIDFSADAILNQMDPVFPVVVFCGGGECDASENVAKRLIGWGFEEVYIMHEGFGAWADAGHPTEPVEGG